MTPTARSRRPRRRRAYILIVVLGYTAIATSLGLAFLDANSTVMPEAVNYKGTVRAQYLAGSGVSVAGHYLMYPPTTVAYNQYWPGANGIAIDATSDYFDVSVLRSDQWNPLPAVPDPNTYRITATGVVHNPDSSIRAKRSVTAEVLVAPPRKWQIPYGYLATATTSIPQRVSIAGNIHSNGSLTGLGFCQGIVSAVASASWTGTGPPAAVRSLQPAFSAPSASPAYYYSYTLRGKTYMAYTGFTANQMTQADADALNAIDMSATNPGRVIRLPPGDFQLDPAVQLNGTLLVTSGNLVIHSGGARRITAVQDFPALVISGNILIEDDDGAIDFAGSVLCGGRFTDNGRSRTAISVSGAAIFGASPAISTSDDTYVFSWNAARSTFWDFQTTPVKQPITVLSWKEN
jgi:hypothetical protein